MLPMAAAIRQDMPLLEALVDCLVAGSQLALCLVKGVVKSSRGVSTLASIMAASICNMHLTWEKSMVQPVHCNVAVAPSACREGTIQPNNTRVLNADNNLASDRSVPELVRAASRVQRTRFIDFEVSAINGDQASAAIVAKESILPACLLCRRLTDGLEPHQRQSTKHQDVNPNLPHPKLPLLWPSSKSSSGRSSWWLPQWQQQRLQQRRS